MSDVALTPRQRQTQAGRQALAAKFSSPEEKSEHYRALAAKANAGRVVLSGDEAEALGNAYKLLGNIVARAARASPESHANPTADEATGEDEPQAA